MVILIYLFSVLSFIWFKCGLLAKELFCMCSLSFKIEGLGTKLGSTGNNFVMLSSFNILYDFREVLTRLFQKGKDIFL